MTDIESALHLCNKLPVHQALKENLIYVWKNKCPMLLS